MHRLEEVMLRCSKSWGVRAARNSLNRGIWVGSHKLGSVGIAIRRGITFHGLALNVDPSMEHFGWINPCGLQDTGVTSIRQQIAGPVSMKAIRETFKDHFGEVFTAALEPISNQDLTARLKRTPE